MFQNEFTLQTDKHFYKIDVPNMTIRIYGIRVFRGQAYPTKKAKTVINFKREFDIYPKVRRKLLTIVKSWLKSLEE